MDTTTTQALEKLIETYGPDAVRNAAQALFGQYAAQAIHTVELSPAVEAGVRFLGESLVAAAKTIERANYKPQGLPAEYLQVLSVESLEHTLTQIDAVAAEVLEKGKARQEAYGDRKEKVRLATTLETEIKLVEAEAVMNMETVGRDTFVMVGDRRVNLGNETARDAYRRTYSKAQRERKAAVDADINALEIDYRKADDAYAAAVEMSKLIGAKAHVQASLLTFLSTRQ